MRCLQCGKDVPIFKRLAGNEFCSEAHRREYHKEYSQLALGRLLQSKASEAAMPAPAAPPKNVQPDPVAANGAAAPVAKPVPAAVRTESPVRTPVPPAKKVEPTRTAPPQPERARFQMPAPKTVTPVEPAPREPSEPAIAAATRIQKPAPAAFPITVVVTAEFERAFPSLTPDRPRREASMSMAALAQASSVPLEHRIEIADAEVHPMEHELELRDAARPDPVIGLDLRIATPGSLGVQAQSLSVPEVSGAAPGEPALWTAPQQDFTGSVLALGEYAKFELFTVGFGSGDETVAAGGVATSPADERGPVETVAAPTLVEGIAEPTPAVEPAAVDDTETSDENVVAGDATPEPALDPLPVEVQPAAAGRTKPVQAFGAAHFPGEFVRVPQPSGLPLRPVMVLGPAGSEGTPASIPAVNKRKPDVRILPPSPVKPSMPAVKTPPPASAMADLGLPQLRLQSSQSTSASRTPKLLAAAAGVAFLGIGGFWLLGNHTNASSKPAVQTSISGDQWISDFVNDARHERRVSVLRSSMGVPAYRLDFESSIQIKGLGWVYRAQDPKNFYVSKIELQRPGQNPTFVIAHYAVINGVDQPRVEQPLKVAVPLGGRYKVRFYAVGDRFTTWLQDQQVDQWSDARLKTGGAGLFSEGAEQSTLYGGFQVTPLIKEQ